MRWQVCGDYIHARQIQRERRRIREIEVPGVNWIEGAAENADASRLGSHADQAADCRASESRRHMASRSSGTPAPVTPEMP